jgi:hypothetical protein
MVIARKIINQRSAVLELIKGTKADSKEFFAYVLFPADVFEEIKDKFNKEEIDISKYGIVIHSDFGSEPPEGLEEKVLEHFKENYLK